MGRESRCLREQVHADLSFLPLLPAEGVLMVGRTALPVPSPLSTFKGGAHGR
jgi:hypothetical protein